MLKKTYIFAAMQTINYPLLCFPLAEDATLGILVGTEFEAVEASPRKLKALLLEHLKKKVKKDGSYPMLELGQPVLKMVEVSFRPTYRQSNSVFPLSGKVRLSVPLVYGECEPGVYDCFLPLLDENFYCYDLSQLDSLTKHFIHNSLDDEDPELIYRLATYPVPTLETVVLRIKEQPSRNFDVGPKPAPKVLERLAEKYPYPKAIQRNLGVLPDAAWELDHYVERALAVLRQQGASLLLVGNRGVGKSAVLKLAMRKLTSPAKKDSHEGSCWRIQAQRFTATSKYLGEWQETLEELVWELSSFGGILWIEDIVRLVQEGGKGAEDSVAAYLLPFIQQRKVQVAGEVTPQELESIRRQLPGFAESLQVLEIRELPEAAIHTVFEKFVDFAAQNLKVAIEPDAVQATFHLLKRFYHDESFPGKGIRFLEECLNTAIFHKKNELTRTDVIAQFIQRTGFPQLFLRDDLLLDQQELADFFHQRIIGQAQAVQQVCDVVKVFKAGLNNPHKPIATLIFAGPTGVGKTATAQALADYFFGKGQRKSPLIRIDMSEFQHPSQITRFLGAGTDPGKLVMEVRERPFSVLLLDEAEKAAPSIFDAFLTLLDEGMMVDAFGRVTNFRNCIIVLTTNLGASNRASIGFGSKMGSDDLYQAAIGAFFKPEFVNRIDNILVFQPLGQEQVRQIAQKELETAKQREGFVKRNLTIQFLPGVVDYLTNIGFDEKYGARPLQRALEDYIVQPLAKWMLENRDISGQTLAVDFDGEIRVAVAVRP